MRLQLSLCLALLALAGDALAQAPRKGGYLRASVELRARSAAEVERVETVTTDIRQTRAEHRPVSDLMLRLSADGGAIDTALQTANAVAGAKSSPLFRAELYIVVAGRIVRDANATCARWVDDMAVCRMDCDGGAFALRRRGRESLAMVVGQLPRAEPEAARQGFALNACATGDQSELALAPGAGRPFVEVVLSEE